MDGWTIVVLPTLSNSDASDRTWAIASWITASSIDLAEVGISSRIVRFKNEVDATLFKLSFAG